MIDMLHLAVECGEADGIFEASLQLDLFRDRLGIEQATNLAVAARISGSASYDSGWFRDDPHQMRLFRLEECDEFVGPVTGFEV
jgi:hypothetical protein